MLSIQATNVVVLPRRRADKDLELFVDGVQRAVDDPGFSVWPVRIPVVQVICVLRVYHVLPAIRV
tara:strand:+ start:1371 stop:1565 length:195 start_codon:yes stop_codon:yes gene_type:complete